MARRGAYRSDKRRKELDRLKKQEEKRQKRFNREKGLEDEQMQEEGQESPEDSVNEDETEA